MGADRKGKQPGDHDRRHFASATLTVVGLLYAAALQRYTPLYYMSAAQNRASGRCRMPGVASRRTPTLSRSDGFNCFPFGRNHLVRIQLWSRDRLAEDEETKAGILGPAPCRSFQRSPHAGERPQLRG